MVHVAKDVLKTSTEVNVPNVLLTLLARHVMNASLENTDSTVVSLVHLTVRTISVTEALVHVMAVQKADMVTNVTYRVHIIVFAQPAYRRLVLVPMDVIPVTPGICVV